MTIEKIFMAAESNTQLGRLVGPFNTAAEAEIRAQQLGWDWVAVYANAVDENGRVGNVQKWFYQPTRNWSPSLLEQCEDRLHRTPEEVEELHRFFSTPDIKPLTGEEAEFFAPYEHQMQKFVVEGGVRRSAFIRLDTRNPNG